MLLGRKAEPFDDPDCLYELKFDGFRALAVVRDGDCQLISRNGNAFESFDGLRTGFPSDLRVRSAVLDGEIACLDSSGRSVFDDVFFRRREPVFIAFDILSVGGDDLRFLPIRTQAGTAPGHEATTATVVVLLPCGAHRGRAVQRSVPA